MALTDDERKAVEHQERLARRPEAERQRRLALGGNVQARRDLDARWVPLKDWLDANDPHGEGLAR